MNDAQLISRIVALEKELKELHAIAEISEVLDGSRNRQSRQKAAVRVEDLVGFGDIPIDGKSRTVTGNVTPDDHNRLVADMKELRSAIATAGNRIKVRGR